MKIKNFFQSTLFRLASTYGALNIVRQMIPFFLLPIITHYLTPADYGVLSMFSILITFVYTFVSLNMDGSIGREYFEKELIDFPNFVSNCLYVAFLTVCLLIPILYFFGSYVNFFTGVPSELLWFVLVIASARFITQIMLVIWQSSKKPFNYGLLQITQTFVEVSLAVIFIVLLKMGLMGRVQSILISTCLFSMISLYWLSQGKWLRSGFNFSYMKKALAFGIPLIPHVIGGMAISMTDRILLMNMLGEKETGLYFIGFQIGNIVSMIVVAFNQAWGPWVFENLNKNDELIKRKIVKFTYVYFVAVLFLVLCVSVAAPVLFYYFLGEKFRSGLSVVVWSALGSGFLGMYYMTGTYITYARKTHILSWITLLVGGFNLVASYFLIKLNGFVGAAQGAALAYFLSFILTWLLAMKSYRMPWSLKVESSNERP